MTQTGYVALSALLALALGSASPGVPHRSLPAPDGPRLAYVCLLSGQRVEINRKTCYYDCAGSVETRVVKPYDDCPLSVHK